MYGLISHGQYIRKLFRDVRKPHENPSIGILLCKTADIQVVEYAMSRNINPLLVAKYEKELMPKGVLQNYLWELDAWSERAEE